MKSPTPLEVTYQDSKGFIMAVCYQYRRRHGGDIDDIVSVANEAFMHAYREWDPERCSFLGNVKFFIWHTLLTEIRTNIRHRKRLVNVELSDVVQPYRSGFDRSRFAQALSAQARLVLKLSLDTPPALERQIQAAGGKPRNYRKVIRKYLMSQGWSYQDVAKAFREVRDGLRERLGDL